MDTLTRRRFLEAGGGAVLAGTALPWLLSACGGGGGKSQTPATLQLSNDKAAWKPYFTQEGTAQKKADGVSWTINGYADTSTYQAAIRTAGGTRKAPDLFTWWSGWLMKDIVDASLADDVTSLWDSAGSAYSKDLRQAFTFNGKTYGAPLYFGYWVTFYNKKVFDQYNLTPPKTWSDMQHVLQTLKANGVIPLGATVDGRWPSFIYFETLLLGSNPTLYQNLMAGKAKYTDPGVVQVMQQWGDMIKAGYFTNPGSVTFGTTGNNFVNLFAQGKAGMVVIGSWYEPTLTGANMKAGQDYDAFIWPNSNSRAAKAIIFESGPLVVAAHGAHRDAARKSLEWFMSKEGQQTWNKATGFTSARADVPSTSPVDIHLASSVKTGGYKLVNRYWEATPQDIVQTAVDEFAKFMLDPSNPTAILQAIQTKADSVWSTVK